MFDDEKLVPDLIKWRKENGASFSIDDWTNYNGNISLAIGYSLIFGLNLKFMMVVSF